MKNEQKKKEEAVSERKKRRSKSTSSPETSKIAASGEIQYGHTIGRHGTDDEKNLNPEE
jgi:hypothetical protein